MTAEDTISLKGEGLRQTPEDFRAGAEIIGCDPLMLQAVFNVEAPDGGFRGDGRPTILPEEHKIYRYADPAQRKALKRAGLASTTRWNKRQYKRFHKISRYEYLEKCLGVAPTAALMGTSWGLGQIMGFNHRKCGYEDVHTFVRDACHSEGRQILQAARFIVATKLDDEFRDKDFEAIERVYNGGGYGGRYAARMRNAYIGLGGSPVRDMGSARRGALRLGKSGDAVRRLQLRLRELGYHIDADGDFGKATKRAVIAFQVENNLKPDGVVGAATREALEDAETTGREEKTVAQTTAKSTVSKTALAGGTGAVAAVAGEIAENAPSGAAQGADRAMDLISSAGDKAHEVQGAVSGLRTLIDFATDNMVLMIGIALVACFAYLFLRNHQDIRTGKKRS